MAFAHRGIGAYGRGVIYALGAGLALGTLGPISNVAYEAGMGSSTFAALRATIGAAVIVAVILATRHPTVRLAELTGRERGLLGLTAAAQAGLSLTLFAAYATMPVALVLAAYFCYPALVAGASIALGRERLTPTRALALALALAGLLAMFLGGEHGSLEPSVAGLVLALLAAGCQAAYLIVARTGFTRVPSQRRAGSSWQPPPP